MHSKGNKDIPCGAITISFCHKAVVSIFQQKNRNERVQSWLSVSKLGRTRIKFSGTQCFAPFHSFLAWSTIVHRLAHTASIFTFSDLLLLNCYIFFLYQASKHTWFHISLIMIVLHVHHQGFISRSLGWCRGGVLGHLFHEVTPTATLLTWVRTRTNKTV